MDIEKGRKHSRYFGAEYYANRDNSTRQEYIESCVMAYDDTLSKVHQLPVEEQSELVKAFNAGIEDEKKAIGEL